MRNIKQLCTDCGGGLDGKHEYLCKACMARRARDYYHKNKENRDKRKVEFKRRIYEYLLLNPCVDCGEDNPIVLEFDHVRGEKNFNISVALAKGTYLWETIIEEIEKCDVRCANCHKIRTSEQQGWLIAKWHRKEV